jgi:hypothetical protein
MWKRYLVGNARFVAGVVRDYPKVELRLTK